MMPNRNGLPPLLLLLLLATLIACNTPVPQATPGATETPAPSAQVSPTQPTAEPTPSVISPAEGLCPEVPRPALVLQGPGDGTTLTLTALDDSARCTVMLAAPANSPILAAAGSLFYQVMDSASQTITVWQLKPDGTNSPLAFTSQPIEPAGPYGFTVSADGGKIAWSRSPAIFGEGAPRFQNTLWVANLDGSEPITLLEALEIEEFHVLPMRFGPDNATLVYSLQPTGVGGSWVSFSGRHQALVGIPVAGGEPTTLFDCGSVGLFLCIGDLAPDGQTVAYTEAPNGPIKVVGAGGTVLGTWEAPGSDFVGFPTFSPTGQLAFVSALLNESSGDGMFPVPEPGYISTVEPPYTGEPETLLSEVGVATLWQWLDANHLIYNHLAPSESGMMLVSTEGALQPLPGYVLTILR